MTNPDPKTWCGVHCGPREQCGCVLIEPYMVTQKCSECGSPTAAPMEVRGRLYCRDHGAEAADAWGCWVVYYFDMGEHIDAVFPGEIEALRYAVKTGCGWHVKFVTAGEVRGQLK